MAVKLADMYVDLDLNTAGFKAELAAATGQMRSADAASGSLGKSTTAASAGMTKLKTGAKVAGAALATGAAYGAWKAANAASDLSESLNKVDVVFGRQSKNVIRWSKDSANSLLVSQAAALEAAGSLGSMLKPMGFSEQAAAKMSKRMVQLSADMASFNNADPTEMLANIQSGLSGEMEPLKKYGSVLSETRVQEYAWAEGIAKRGKELSEQQKVQARYRLLLEDTTDAQGDVERTGDGMANSLRTLQANVTDLAAKMGSGLMPVVADVSNGLNDFFDVVLGRKGGKGMEKPAWLTGLMEAGSDVADFFVGLWDDIKRNLPDGDDMQSFIKALRNLWTATKAIWNNALKPIMERIGPAFKQAFGGVVQVVRGFVEIFAGIFTGDFGKIWEGVKDIVGGTMDYVVGILRTATAPIRELASKIGDVVKVGIGGAWKFVTGVVRGAVDKMLGLFSSLLGAAADAVGGLSWIPAIGGKFDGLADKIRGVQNEIDGFREELRGDDKATKQEIEDLKKLTKGWQAVEQQVADTTASVAAGAKKINLNTGKVSDKAKDSSRSWADSWVSMKTATGSALAFIGNKTNKSLVALGVEKAAFGVMTGASKVGLKDGGIVPGLTKGAVVPGSGSGDKVPLHLGGRLAAMVEPGEFVSVANRTATAALMGINGSVKRKANGGIVGRFANGGWVDPAGPGTGVVNPAIADVVGAWSTRYNAAINYGYDPGGGHVSAGHNVTGTATDTGPAGEDWYGSGGKLFETGLRAISGQVDQLLYGSHGIGTPYPNHGFGNHAHIEWGMHPDVQMAVADLVKRVKITGPDGAMKGVAQGAADLVRRFANKAIQAAVGTGGGADTYSGGGTFGIPELESLWTAVNGGLAEASTMARIAIAESSGNPNAIGNDPGGTKGYGLWQITSGFHDDLIAKYGGPSGILDPKNNAAAAGSIFQNEGYGAWDASAENWRNGGVLKLAKGGVIFDPPKPDNSLLGGRMTMKGGELVDHVLGMVDRGAQLGSLLRQVVDPGPQLRVPNEAAAAITKDFAVTDLLAGMAPSPTADFDALRDQYGDSSAWDWLLDKPTEYMEYADRASALGEYGGMNEAGWLEKALGALFDSRNAAITQLGLGENVQGSFVASIVEPLIASIAQRKQDYLDRLAFVRAAIIQRRADFAREVGALIERARAELKDRLAEVEATMDKAGDARKGLRDKIHGVDREIKDATDRRDDIDKRLKHLRDVPASKRTKDQKEAIERLEKERKTIGDRIGDRRERIRKNLNPALAAVSPGGQFLAALSGRRSYLNDHLAEMYAEGTPGPLVSDEPGSVVSWKADQLQLAQDALIEIGDTRADWMATFGDELSDVGGIRDDASYALTSILDDIQGAYSPTNILSSLPDVGVLGGQILSTQLKLRDLGGDTGGGGGSESELERTRLQLEQAMATIRQRDVASAQAGVFAGMFAAGGYIPAGGWGIAGEAGAEIVRGPAQVYSNSDSRGMLSSEVRVILEDHRTTVLVDGVEVEAIVDRKLDKISRGRQYGKTGTF